MRSSSTSKIRSNSFARSFVRALAQTAHESHDVSWLKYAAAAKHRMFGWLGAWLVGWFS